MSSLYELNIQTQGLRAEQVLETLVDRFGWEELDSDQRGDYAECSFHGSLLAGETETDAHKRIYDDLKSLNPAAKIRTRWTCLEPQPFSEYGDTDVEATSSEGMTRLP